MTYVRMLEGYSPLVGRSTETIYLRIYGFRHRIVVNRRPESLYIFVCRDAHTLILFLFFCVSTLKKEVNKSV